MRRRTKAGLSALAFLSVFLICCPVGSSSGTAGETPPAGSSSGKQTKVEGEKGDRNGGNSGREADDSAYQLPFDRNDNEVQILPGKQQLAGIRTVEVSKKPLHKEVRTVGRVEYDETRISTVNIKFEGWVEKLYADFTGQYVRKGATLADIYSPEYLSTQLEFVNLLQWKNEKAHRFQRNIEFRWGDRFGTTGQLLTFDIEALLHVARQKMELWEIPADEINKIEADRKAVSLYRVKSPISGYVVEKPALLGKKVAPGEKLFDIVDLSTVWVIADIYDYELPFIKKGLPARISLSYLPQRTFDSKIDYIYPTLSEKTRTVKVRFVVANPDVFLKPGMYANVELDVGMGEVLAVPEDAVIDTGTRQIVYVEKGDGYFEQREISSGLRAGRMVEVLEGLEAGERVVSSAAFLVDSETKLQKTGKRSCCAP